MRLLNGPSRLRSLLLLLLSISFGAIWLIKPVVASTASQTPSEHDYNEQLTLRPLPGNSLLASFDFRSNGSVDGDHMLLFPRSLKQVLQASWTRELHLKFTLGRWNAEEHGAQPGQGMTAGGTGVELWAWIEADDDDEAFARWTTLTNALSGLFCASLNFIDGTRTIRPVITFQPTGHHSNDTLSRLHLLHGSLPREPVCTENLTPFLKLLPCKGKMGISTLLDGHKLFDANWQSMSIDVRPVCNADESECKLEMEQSVDMVVDIERALRRRDSPVPKPRPHEQLVCDETKPYVNQDDSCFPLDNVADLGWSLSEIFGRPVLGTCPFGIKEGVEPLRVCLEAPHARPVYPSVGAQERNLSPELRCYILPEKSIFDITVPIQQPSLLTLPPRPSLYAERTFTGYGQERGGVQTILKNPSPDKPIHFVYLESLPWFMKPYLHTLSARLDPPPPPYFSNIAHNSHQQDTLNPLNFIKDTYYRPALDRARGTHLEVRMLVPQNSTVVLTYDFEKAILRYTEYPPDANRGFDVAPAIIGILQDDGDGDSDDGDRYRGHASSSSSSSSPPPHPNAVKVISYLRTTSLLLYLPTPDFSMPYNVIILTSTVIALAFGTVFNILVRRFVLKSEVPRIGGKIGRFLALLAAGWKKGS